MRTKKDEKFKLESVEELLGVVNEESAMDIEISKIQPFRAHPFKVLDDDKMQELIDSISVNGILTPVLLSKIIEREMCEEILSRMNARQKFAVLSYYVEGNSQKEIAERMKTTQQAVAGLIIRTVDRIRNEMKNADGEMEAEKNKKCTFGVVF